MDPMGKRIVFVYGTLQFNFRNHGVLENSPFHGQGVLSGYALYHLPQGYPGIVVDPNGKVRGELYEVSASTLAELDRFEGEGYLYRRTGVMVTIEGQERPVHADVYGYLQPVFPEWKDPHAIAHWTPANEQSFPPSS